MLRNIRSQYPRAWQRYGFLDAFNPLTGWYDSDVLGIDAGITMLMAEDLRSNFVWNTFHDEPGSAERIFRRWTAVNPLPRADSTANGLERNCGQTSRASTPTEREAQIQQTPVPILCRQ